MPQESANISVIHEDTSRPGYRDDALAIASLLLLLALRSLPTLLHGRLYAPFGDNVFIYGPMFSETARIALQGEYPFYLPSFGGGFPLYQSPHYSPFYPFYFFGLLDYGGPLQSLYTLTYLAILHQVILALNFFILLRCARISPWAAFAGASVGVIAHNTEVYSGWITIASSYTWLPLLVAGGIRLLQNPRSLGGIILSGVSGGLLALASTSQSVAHALLFSCLFFAAGAVWLARKEGGRSVGRLIVSLLLAGALAFGLGAVSAAPVYLGIDDMVRHIGSAFVVGHEKIPWPKFNQTQIAPGDLLAILFGPGTIEIVGSPYIGPLGVAGVIFAFVFFQRLNSREKFFVATIGGIGLYGLLSAFGTHFGFAYLNYHLPLLDKIREGGRYLALFVIAVVFLCGIGFDQLGRFLREEFSQPRRRRATSVGLGVTALFFIGVTTWELLRHAPLARGGVIILLLTPAIALLRSLLKTSSLRPILLGALPVSIAAAISPVRTFSVGESEYSRTINLRNLEILSALRNKIGADSFRIDFVDDQTNPYTWTMNASYFGFRSFYNRVTPQPYEQFRFGLQHKPPALREIMGGRYVLCAPGKKPYDPAARARFPLNGYTVFENPAYMERLTFVHSLADTISSQQQFLARVSRRFDFRQSVCIPQNDADRLRPFLDARTKPTTVVADRLELLNNSENRISARLKTARPGIVVLNEWFTPAWHARVNGKAETIVRANQWQVGVPIRAGRNRIEFTYRPFLPWFLLIVNRISWIFIGLLAVVSIFRYHVRGRPEKRNGHKGNVL